MALTSAVGDLPMVDGSPSCVDNSSVQDAALDGNSSCTNIGFPSSTQADDLQEITGLGPQKTASVGVGGRGWRSRAQGQRR